MAAEIILIIATALLAWTYVIYPVGIIAAASLGKKMRSRPGPPLHSDSLPTVTVVMSLHNENKVVEAKIRSMLASDYPGERLDFIIGSDGSGDGTNAIISTLSATDSRIHCIIHAERRGKVAMLNDLVAKATGEILVVTDANVIFTPATVRRLAEAFADPGVGLCDATVNSLSGDYTGITGQENLYSRFETALKRAEGDLWGAMPGPYGGCYAVRRRLFPRLPENTLADDLYVGLSVLRQNFRSVNNPGANVYEDTQPDMMAQFRRRIRIAAGSFQNLFRFGPCPSRRFSTCFTFFSHKIMRWLTPLLLGVFFMTTVILSGRSVVYFCLTSIQMIFIILSALDLVLDRQGKRVRIQRFVTQFLLMNAALAAGFVKAVRGIETGIWEPTKRV
jgi:cellulose synthase/poly-beta-1,6-N-acetylglucosamine synthase-like glycosyltransferase